MLRSVLALLRLVSLVALALATVYVFLLPGATLVRDLADPAMSGPGIPHRAVALHRDLTPRFEDWADARVASGRAAEAPLHDVATTEWPMFTAVFYLMATDAILEAGDEGTLRWRSAVDAARDLLLDPSHHTWVRTHWGEGYLHRENLFFRSLLIAGLTSHARLTGDPRSLAPLRDQVDTLARDLDASELGLLEDYPGECYPIDVVAAIGLIRRADAVLGTDHAAFAARAVRGFVGDRGDPLGLVPFRVELPSGAQLQPARGIGMSWVLSFSPDLWPEQSKTWYETYEAHFWQDRGWAAGFREYERATEPEWTFEIDAGPVVDGFGTAASAFGIAAARRHGRFDHAYALSTELVASAWPLPDGTLSLPRAFSHAGDAPHLGEAAILYFLTVQPAPGFPVIAARRVSGLVILGLVVYFGVSGLAAFRIVRELRRPAMTRGLAAIPALVLGIGASTAGVAIAALGQGFVAALAVAVGLVATWRPPSRSVSASTSPPPLSPAPPWRPTGASFSTSTGSDPHNLRRTRSATIRRRR
jgi:hypothetical protein